MHSVTALFRVDTSAAALDGYGRALATFARRQLDPASVGEAALDARAQKTSGVTATITPYPLAALSDGTRRCGPSRWTRDTARCSP